MFSRIGSGTLSFDREIDPVLLPEQLARSLRTVHASTVEVTGTHVTFTAGLFRMVGNWNVLVPFGSGDLSVQPDTCEVRYTLSCLQLIVIATMMTAFMGAIMLVSPGMAAFWFLPLMWLWLVGGNLAIGVFRFRGFVARCLANAPRKSKTPLELQIRGQRFSS